MKRPVKIRPRQDLAPLLTPESIAIVGISQPGRFGGGEPPAETRDAYAALFGRAGPRHIPESSGWWHARLYVQLRYRE